MINSGLSLVNKNYIAIDLGGTKTAIALFSSGELQDLIILETPRDPEEFLVLVIDKLEYLDLNSVAAIGVGAAGFWDKECILKQSINLPRYVNFPLWDQLSRALNLPLFLKTDVELAVLGQAIFGLNNEYSNVLYLNLGTGFGGALYKDGEIFSTEYSPTLRLDFMVQAELEDSTETISENLQSISVLASTIINLACILSPQIICIGGGKVESNWEKIIEPAINRAQKYLDKVLTYPIIIQRSQLQYPTLYGAYELARRNS